MKTATKLGVLLLSSTMLLSACQRSGSSGNDLQDPYAQSRGDLKVTSNITTPSTRVQGEKWETSDAIGVFAINAGSTVGSTNVATNAKYTTATAGANVKFTSLQGVNVPATGNIDIVAYYPYAEDVTDEVSFNTSNQSNPALIDLLYSNNQKNINKDNLNANLVFDHMLTAIEFQVTASDMTISKGTIALGGVKVDGKMAISNGAVTTGTTTGNPSVIVVNEGNNRYKGMLILPPQNLKDKEVTFNFDGKTYTAKLSLNDTESSYKYIVKVTYSKEKSKLLIVEGATINPWKEGGENGETIIIGGDDDPTPDPAPDPTPDPAPARTPLFPGANFDDWEAFIGSLNKFGLKNDLATQVDGGYTGKALHISGTPKKPDFLFNTTVQPNTPAQASKIVFYIKGTSGNSLSINVYSPKGKCVLQNGDKYDAFNIGTVSGTDDVTLKAKGKNSYTGSINTQGEWVKVTLDVSGTELATSGNFFAVRVGKEKAYDLMIDDFTIE